MKLFSTLLIALGFFSCKSSIQNLQNFESDILKIKKINNHIFQHVSFIQTNDYGKVACNGMVYINKNEAIIFDTPVNNKASKQLIDWITKNNNKKIKALIVTHFHNDCLGGIHEFHKEKIDSYANALTIALAKKDSIELPENSFKSKIKFKVGGQVVTTQFFGEGHTADNVIGYIPSEKTLFGGCLIKSNNAGKGYLGDANVLEWSNTVASIKREYPNLEIVIPGHGKHGGIELLDYTINLFKH
ncbi:subclass B1 metallo-beta-lactamase [Hyunsoonleella ulvae]|uniref:subclass B1 metallo-beta-lactamase n=1 Tax=Hyunsoonleella ulvae TaxID=2799948 RepID=UPI001939F3B7|nr:subclass B1 metallo-beta-lactamase [Hyunsoonleella ulvae]